jgi:Tfp pilus assembly protein PilE
MIKMNNKGFFLAETIVAVTIVAAVLVIFYTQISVLYRNYERNGKYYTVEALHAARNISTYIDQNYTDKPIGNSITSANPIIDITNYSFDTTGYYISLVNNLNIKKVFFSSYNINDVITNYTNYNINASFLDFLRTLKVISDKTNTYRVIVELNNGEYASANLVVD